MGTDLIWLLGEARQRRPHSAAAPVKGWWVVRICSELEPSQNVPAGHGVDQVPGCIETVVIYYVLASQQRWGKS